MHTRAPAVDGLFYPSDQHQLVAAVDKFLTQAQRQDHIPKAIIAPHAGYEYSGPIAGSAYAQLLGRTSAIEKVVLIGPSHRMRFDGIATSKSAMFDCPLGPLTLDHASIDQAVALGLVKKIDAVHAPEHSLEVHLPFLKRLLPQARLIPLLTGDEDDRKVHDLLAHLWGGEETLILVSSDLSHYHSAETAERLDLATARKIERFSGEILQSEEACGATAINGLLAVAREKGLSCKRLDLRHSGHTAGSRDRVVGYGAFAF